MLLGGHRTQNHTFGDGGLDALWAVSLGKSSVSKVTLQPGSGDFPDAFGLGGPDSSVPGILSFDCESPCSLGNSSSLHHLEIRRPASNLCIFPEAFAALC